MKKTIIISVVALLIIIGVAVKIYFNAVDPVREAEEKALKRAQEELNITDVNRFTIYNGNESIYILDGQRKDGEDVYAWVPEKDGKIIVKKKSEGITKEEALQTLLNEKNPKEIISIRIGMESNIPLWEIAYRTEGDLLNYYMIDFETGKTKLKIIENL
ncbi:cell wall elongation regulator TseB-like domain-containing protein [Cytobacillus purgationiresistens]|uniref:Uncharacterized protein YpmB n=1 Tax=Cytobacillus purgationiresistens TaxID=863449 RepID=A0ABU0AIG0_9BACI|nr:DUF5590 domain-containing protein [Cytobacillus purgationiresistens]MDQ0271048.1 uncharacterized protein YpmB [Cytobacillus purgationiresistens]